MTLVYLVELYELNSKAKQEKIATFVMREDFPGNVSIEGNHDHPVVVAIKGEGVFDYKYAKPNKLFPWDGMVFLENLKYHFRSGYLLATDIQKKTIDI